MTKLRPLLMVVLLALILSPQLSADRIAAPDTHDLKPQVVMLGMKYPPSLRLPLRDLKSALSSDEIATLYTRGGFLSELYYVDRLGVYIHMIIEESIWRSGSNETFLEDGDVVLRYSGYMVKTEVSSYDRGKTLELTTTVLQGEKAFIHTVCASEIEGVSPEVTLLITVFPTPSSIIQYPGKGFVVEFKRGVVAFWLLDEEGLLNVSMSRRNLLEVKVSSRNPVGGYCLRLVIVMDRDLEDVMKRLDSLKGTWARLAGGSEEFFAKLVVDLPGIDVATEELKDLYYLSLYLQLNSLTREGVSRNGIRASALDLWSAALMLPLSRSRVLKTAILNEISNIVTQAVREGVPGLPPEKVSLLSTATLALYEYCKASPEHVDTTRPLFSLLNHALLEKGLDNILRNLTTPLDYAFAAQLLKTMYDLSRLLGDEKPVYVVMYREAVDMLESTFLNMSRYVHAAGSNASLSVGGNSILTLALLSMLESRHKDEYLDLIAKTISRMNIPDATTSQYELCTAFIALARGGYADVVHSVLTDVISRVKSGTLDEVPPCINAVVLRGYLGLEPMPQGILIRPSIPITLSEISARVFAWDSKVSVIVRGCGNNVKRTVVNNELLETPYVPREMLKTNDENLVFIEMLSPPRKLLRVRVLKEHTPLNGVLVRIIVNDSIEKRAYTDPEGEAVFIVPQKAKVYVEAEYEGVKYSVSTFISSAKYDEITITIPEGSEGEFQRDVLSNITMIENSVSALSKKLASLEKELETLKKNVSKLLAGKAAPQPTPSTIGGLLPAVVALVVSVALLVSVTLYLYGRGIFKRIKKEKRRAGSTLKKLPSIGLVVLLFMYLLGGSVAFCNEASLMAQQHTFSYTLTEWGGWVLQVYVQTRYPWIVGLEAHVAIKVMVKEAVPNTTLSITKLTLSLGTLEVSSYVGKFSHVGESRDVNLTLPLVDPELAEVIPGERTTKPAILTLEGYVEVRSGERNLYTSTLEIPVQITAVPSTLKVEVRAPEDIELGDYALLEVFAKNVGVSEIYSLTLTVYVNKELLESKFVGRLPPGAVVRIFVPFKPQREGVYTILARANYTTSLNKVYATIHVAKLRVRRSLQLMIYVDSLKTEVFDTVTIKGITNPPIANLSLNLEVSSDGGISWSVIGACTTDPSGKCSFQWTPSSPGVYELRAHFIGSDTYLEAFSNVIRITASKKAPVLRLEIRKSTVKVNEKVTLRVSVKPKIPTVVKLEYKLLEEKSWRKYADVKLNEDGQGSVTWVPLKPGTYVFRAVLNENKVLLSTISNTITLKVINYSHTSSRSIASGSSLPGPPLPESIAKYIMIGVVIVSIAIGTALLFRWRKT